MLQALCGMGKLREVLAAIEGAPNVPVALRVSATRHGGTGTKRSPEKLPLKVAVVALGPYMIPVHTLPTGGEGHPVQLTNVEAHPAVAVSVTILPPL